MGSIKNPIITIFFLLLSLIAGAQDYTFNSQFYGIEEGLSHRDVQCIHQDKQGIMWFGTRYGLNRFDGYNFKWYVKETHGLQSNEINHILEDQNGHFWLVDTDAHFLKGVFTIDIFDPKTEKTQSFEEAFADQVPFKATDIVCFNQNEAGHFIFLTRDNHLVTYDGSFKSAPISFSVDAKIDNIHWAPDDLMWIVGQGTYHLMAFDLKGNKVHQFAHPGFVHAKIYDFDKHGNCRYLITTKEEYDYRSAFFRINRDGIQRPDTIIKNSTFSSYLKSFAFTEEKPFVTQKQLLWFAGDKNLEILDLEQASHYQPEKQLPQIPDVTDIFFDINGLIWVSTQFGIFSIEVKKNRFFRILYNYEGGKPAIRNITVDDSDNLWIVREGFLNLWKIDLENKAVYKTNPSITDQILPIDDMFNVIINNSSGLLYYASSNKLIKFDPKTYDYELFRIDEQDRKWGFIWSLYEDEYGRVWYASDHGDVGYLDDQKTHWLPPLDTISPPNYIYHFQKDKNGLTWLATNSGLFVLDIKTGKILDRYWFGGTDKHYLPFDNIYHIHEDEDGSFWLATGGSGLIHWNHGNYFENKLVQTEEYDSNGSSYFNQFTRAHGLNNVIYAVYEDDNDHLWLPSDHGIIRFNKNSHRIKTYLEGDGITHNEFNRISHYKAKDGRLFFGGLNGVTAFHPDDFKVDTSSVHASLVITAYQQFDSRGKHSKEKEIMLMDDRLIVLQPNDRFFRLEFALLTYQDADKVLYAYKVEGVDEEWTYQKENFIRFSRLPYGNHILKIKGQSVNGIWSENELTIRLSVLKPFYFQVWFLVPAFLGVFLIGFILYKMRVSQLKKQKTRLEVEVARRTKTIQQQAEELKSLDKLKSRFFTNVSHELRTPLSLMIGPVNSLLKENNKNQKERRLLEFVQRNARQLMKLVNEILDLSKLEDNKLEISEQPVHFFDFIKGQTANFHSFAANEGLEFEVQYMADASLNLFLDESKFEKIIHNFLSNAMKFTPAGGKIRVKVKELETQIRLSVTDTGRGIHPDDLPHIFDRFYQSGKADVPTEGGTGIGLSLCKELATLIGGRVWAESELGKGSTFYLEFPKKIVPLSHAGVLHTDDELIISEKNENISDHEFSMITPASENEEQQVIGHDPLIASKETTILIVEDNNDLREYLEMLLSDYNIVTAEHGQVAWDLLSSQEDKDFPPDLIISDLMMPVMDGFQLLEKIKSNDRWRHLPVIMLTAKANIKAKLRALRIGVDDYLLKPFEEEELKARIENMLSNYKERMAFFRKQDDSPDKAVNDDVPVMGAADAIWLEAVEEVFNTHISDNRLNVDFAANKIHMSRRQFHRRLKQLTGLTPNQYLQEIRLKHAYDLLLQGVIKTVKEACYAVGFNDVTYFSNLFQKRFGTKPSVMR